MHRNQTSKNEQGRRGRDRMVVGLTTTLIQLPMQSVPITTGTDVVSSNLDQGEVYNIM